MHGARILVVGAGLAGLALARALGRAGFAPELIEREAGAGRLRPGRRKERDTAQFTPQEMAVARLVAAGLCNRQGAGRSTWY